MTATLPSPIQNYFAGKNARDFTMAASGFAPRAIVYDEGHDHVGPAAIRAWIETTTAKYDDKAEIMRVAFSGSDAEVTAEVSGTFPGCPILLRFKFTLEGGQISSLKISP